MKRPSFPYNVPRERKNASESRGLKHSIARLPFFNQKKRKRGKIPCFGFFFEIQTTLGGQRAAALKFEIQKRVWFGTSSNELERKKKFKL
jgi:hypothetical protein